MQNCVHASARVYTSSEYSEAHKQKIFSSVPLTFCTVGTCLPCHRVCSSNGLVLQQRNKEGIVLKCQFADTRLQNLLFCAKMSHILKQFREHVA